MIMKKLKIINRFTKKIIFENNATTLRVLIEEAVSKGVNLTGANLTGANLAGANLTGANLTGADLTGADL